MQNMLAHHGLAGASRQAFFKQYKEIEQKSYNAGDAGAHQSLLDHVEGFLDLFYDGVRNGHGVGAASVEGVGLQAVTVFGMPHFGHNANGVALDILAHKGGVMQVNAVAVVLHHSERVGVVFHNRHVFLRFAADHHNRQNYSKYQIFHFPNAFLKFVPPYRLVL